VLYAFAFANIGITAYWSNITPGKLFAERLNTRRETSYNCRGIPNILLQTIFYLSKAFGKLYYVASQETIALTFKKKYFLCERDVYTSSYLASQL